MRTLISEPLDLPDFSCARTRLTTPHLAMLGRAVDRLSPTTVAVVTNLAAPKLPAAQVAEAVRAALG